MMRMIKIGRRKYKAIRHSIHAAILAIILLANAAPSRVAAAQAVPAELSDSARVSLITIYPGEPIYAAFAHSALRFVDEGNGVDLVFNYGTFDFNAPGFVPRFIDGQLDYFLSVVRMRDHMRGWEIENRSVVEQTLRLTADEKNGLWHRLLINAQPENRTYRYDFLAENCSTILLDILRETTTESLAFDSTGTAPESFRELLQPYLTRRPFWDLGINLILGTPVDRDAAYFERSFLPIELMHIVDQASFRSSVESETAIPFVAQTDTLVWRGRGYGPEDAFPYLALVGWILVLVWFLLSLRKPSHRMWPDRLFFGVLGLVGSILLYMWAGTAHDVTAGNWNIAWALPVHLLMAVFWKQPGARFRRFYFGLTGVMAIMLLAAQLVLHQTLEAAFVPVVVAVVWRSWLQIKQQAV